MPATHSTQNELRSFRSVIEMNQKVRSDESKQLLSSFNKFADAVLSHMVASREEQNSLYSNALSKMKELKDKVSGLNVLNHEGNESDSESSRKVSLDFLLLHLLI